MIPLRQREHEAWTEETIQKRQPNDHEGAQHRLGK